MKRIYALLVAVLLCTTNGMAQSDPSELNGAGYFKFNDDLKDIFHSILNLKLRAVLPKLNAEKNRNVSRPL